MASCLFPKNSIRLGFRIMQPPKGHHRKAAGWRQGLDIGNVGHLDLIHIGSLERALCEAFALVFAAFWIGFDVAQFREQGAVGLAVHEQWLADCGDAWVAVNSKTAQAPGLSLSPISLAQVDEVID
jgi:hypothetical protein